MTDQEKLAMVYAHIEAELKHLSEVLYHHRANITEPNIEQQTDYLMALGERRALMELSHKLMGVESRSEQQTFGTKVTLKPGPTGNTLSAMPGNFEDWLHSNDLEPWEIVMATTAAISYMAGRAEDIIAVE